MYVPVLQTLEALLKNKVVISEVGFVIFLRDICANACIDWTWT